MLRHLDAAWEQLRGRRIYGLFIVEAEEGSGSVEPSFTWRQAVDTTISEEILKGSLPHRSPEQRSQIAAALLGVTTWQALCDKFRIPREVLIPEVLDNQPERRTTVRKSGGVPQPSNISATQTG